MYLVTKPKYSKRSIWKNTRLWAVYKLCTAYWNRYSFQWFRSTYRPRLCFLRINWPVFQMSTFYSPKVTVCVTYSNVNILCILLSLLINSFRVVLPMNTTFITPLRSIYWLVFKCSRTVFSVRKALTCYIQVYMHNCSYITFTRTSGFKRYFCKYRFKKDRIIR